MLMCTKPWMIKLMLLFLVACVIHAERVKRGVCSTRSLAIPNGTYRIRSSNSYVVYSCNQGYSLYGTEQLNCIGTSWSPDPPQCIINHCPPLSPIPHSNMTTSFDGALVNVDCDVGYRLVGAAILVCPGENWSDSPPTCEKWTPPKQCDFEDEFLCGWTHHDYSDVKWRWNSGTTRTKRTGPDHDHTLGASGDGHYLYFETSSPTSPDHRAILISPKYPAAYSRGSCFTFWYHSYGSGKIGNLQVYFKPIDAELNNLTSHFYVNENKGLDWQFENLTIPVFNKPFQITFVATRATSYRSDFAVDDVNLVSDCLWKPTQNTTSISTTTPTTTTTSMAPTTTSTSTSTPAPSTALVTSPIPMTNATNSPNSTTIGSSNSTFVDQTRSTLKPIVNPHDKDERVASASSQSNSSNNLMFILVGVGLVIAIAAVLVVAFICYRKRTTRMESLSAVNPVYTSVHEENVCFIEEDQDGYDRMYI